MSREGYTNRDLADIIECEGLGYSIQYGISANNIKDKELAKLWREADLALTKVDLYIKSRLATEPE